jgi:hypothetical protein
MAYEGEIERAKASRRVENATDPIYLESTTTEAEKEEITRKFYVLRGSNIRRIDTFISDVEMLNAFFV